MEETKNFLDGLELIPRRTSSADSILLAFIKVNHSLVTLASSDPLSMMLRYLNMVYPEKPMSRSDATVQADK
jgi:hypothetical protein